MDIPTLNKSHKYVLKKEIRDLIDNNPGGGFYYKNLYINSRMIKYVDSLLTFVEYVRDEDGGYDDGEIRVTMELPDLSYYHYYVSMLEPLKTEDESFLEGF